MSTERHDMRGIVNGRGALQVEPELGRMRHVNLGMLPEIGSAPVQSCLHFPMQPTSSSSSYSRSAHSLAI